MAGLPQPYEDWTCTRQCALQCIIMTATNVVAPSRRRSTITTRVSTLLSDFPWNLQCMRAEHETVSDVLTRRLRTPCRCPPWEQSVGVLKIKAHSNDHPVLSAIHSVLRPHNCGAKQNFRQSSYVADIIYAYYWKQRCWKWLTYRLGISNRKAVKNVQPAL